MLVQELNNAFKTAFASDIGKHYSKLLALRPLAHSSCLENECADIESQRTGFLTATT